MSDRGPNRDLTAPGANTARTQSRELLVEQLSGTHYDAARRATYLALDVPSGEQAWSLVDKFDSVVDGFKVGLELFHAEGPRFVEKLCKASKRVFLDVKLHDIPNTVAGALNSICQLPVEMVNVHAAGGRAMLARARETVDGARYQPLLIAVSVLTSLNEEDINQIGYVGTVAQSVSRLVNLAVDAELDGVVASALETQGIRKMTPHNFEIVVPGTRPLGSNRDDQARTLTPGAAMANGASRLVIGRAVTKAADPLLALQQIWDDMLSAKVD